jgi:16S rRNA processing protein RimM
MLHAMTQAKRILIAHVAGAHGIAGELVLKCYAQDPLDLKRYGELSDEAGGRVFRVRSVRVAGRRVIAGLEGIGDRNAAEEMQGSALYVAREKLPAAEEGEFYCADLIGLAAVGTDGQRLGTVIDVVDYGAGDLIEVALESGGSALVPFAEGFVGRIDMQARTVEIEQTGGAEWT